MRLHPGDNVKIATHPLACLLLALLLAPLCWAQGGMSSQLTRDGVANWLRGDEPILQAWGAHEAAVRKDATLIPVLLDVAAAWQEIKARPVPKSKTSTGAVNPSPGLPAVGTDESSLNEISRRVRRDAMACVLDALVQLHASVSAKTLQMLADDFPSYVAMLTVNLPKEERQALSQEFLREGRDHSYSGELQYLGARLLSDDSPQGLALKLLSGMHVYFEVGVVEGNSQHATSQGIGDCMGFGNYSRLQWPIFVNYILSTRKGAGSFLLINGANPIYYTQEMVTSYSITWDCRHSPVLDIVARRGLLTQMLGRTPNGLGWALARQETIHARTQAEFERKLRPMVEHELAGYKAMARALLRHKLVTAAEVEQAHPELEVQVSDYRGKGAGPLRRPAFLPSFVTWVGP